jgi:pimeloyl-ACP methyl ester carboxylesterase
MTRHIVLVHGAWQGSWAFEAWRPLLEAQGWQVHAVDLPGNGWGPQADAPANLDSYTAHVEAVVRGIDAPVVLVGHSGGGITVSQVAEAVPERIVALVYLAGMMLPSQTSYVDVLHTLEAESPGLDLDGIVPWLDWNADRTATSVRIEGALRCFVHDCEPQAAQQAAALLRPQPESGRAMRNTLTPERFGRVPRFYVECADDRSLLLPIQQRMQLLSPGATRIAMDCGHVPQLAQPERLTELLLPALDALVE